MRYGLIFGAVSYEHEISIVSAISLSKRSSLDFYFIFCDKNRDFYLIDKKRLKSTLFSSTDYKKETRLTLKKGGFYKKSLFSQTKIEIDIFINLVHGSDGEDGKISSLLEFFDIDYIGPRSEGCIVSFNKLLTKLYADSLGIKTLPYVLYNGNESDIEFDYPIIIKPLRLGSSIGLSVAKNVDELRYAIDVAGEFDNDILIEPYYENIREFNIAGCKTKNGFIFSKVEEPKKRGFLDFETKYLDFSRDNKVNEAKIDDDLLKELQSHFVKIYSTLFDGSIIRCDFFYKDDRIYLNEINPIPGSLAWYLFDDFDSVIKSLCKSLPVKKSIKIDYRYINSIKSSKGKL